MWYKSLASIENRPIARELRLGSEGPENGSIKHILKGQYMVYICTCRATFGLKPQN